MPSASEVPPPIPATQAMSEATRPSQAEPPVPLPAARATSIREADLSTLPALQNLLAPIGGAFDRASVSYATLTGAGEVAIVPIQSGGTAGNLAVAVIGMGGSGAQVFSLLTPDSATRGLRVTAEEGQLVATTSVPGSEDPLCCPSQLRRTYYVWDGAKLRVERQVTVPNASSTKN